MVGIWIGLAFERKMHKNILKTVFVKQGSSKLDQLMQYVQDNYVDTVNYESLETNAIQGMLSSLDPHSTYVSASELKETNDPLMGKFEGIGVQFSIEHDSVMVIKAIAGGPSEKVGILAGDRIISADGTNMASCKITNGKVMKLLKGNKGTKVNLEIYRPQIKKVLKFTVVRNVIPTWSIDASLFYTNGIGYIKLGQFGATTNKELKEILKAFKRNNVNKLILDLRGNAGGYLEEAISVSDEFLPNGNMIVFTKGLNRETKTYHATDDGEWDNKPICILIDEGSASASEIVAGAIQDNDRGVIIGRRSFGKGLVQEQVPMSDGSLMRLTTAKYYTPSGRSIQKPYKSGNENYFLDVYKRYFDGEMENSDSIPINDSLKYVTKGGKIIYGGGGITPDTYIPIDKNPDLVFFNESVNKGILYRFAFEYSDKNRAKLNNFKTLEQFLSGFKTSDEIYKEYIAFAYENNIKPNTRQIEMSKDKILHLFKAYIARNLFDESGFYKIYLETDKTFLKALEISKNQ